MRNNTDTIAAIATGRGEGGIAIIRISGENALKTLKSVFRPSSKRAEYNHGQMLYGRIFDREGRVIDEVMAVYFASPRTYTREDVCEIHTHGGIVADKVLEECVHAGARPAEAGEFTYRAFLNGRIDLSEAEAVMQLIGAKSDSAARASVRQLTGGVSANIGAFKEKLKYLVSLIDAAADFPEEIDEEVTSQTVRSDAKALYDEISLISDKRQARIMNKGASVVIAGRPNVGKSSIMNALLRYERSIVTDIPGTTRDTVNESLSINGVAFTLTDTAGIRETGDIIEKIGVDRAQAGIKEADCVILVLDASRPLNQEDEELLSQKDERYILVANKDDIKTGDFEACIKLSAKTGEGLDRLTEAIYERISPGEQDEKLSSLRHIECAERAKAALERLISSPSGTYLDLMRDDLTEALMCLGEITGENVTEDVIDSVFERFCVGK